MLLLSLVVVIRSALHLRHADEAIRPGEANAVGVPAPPSLANADLTNPDLSNPELGGGESADPTKPWKIIGLTLVAAIVATWLGQVVAFSLLIFVLLVFLDRTAVLLSLVIALAGGLSVWLIFSYFLGIPLS
jgi:hypothetical protein